MNQLRQTGKQSSKGPKMLPNIFPWTDFFSPRKDLAFLRSGRVWKS